MLILIGLVAIVVGIYFAVTKFCLKKKSKPVPTEMEELTTKAEIIAQNIIAAKDRAILATKDILQVKIDQDNAIAQAQDKLDTANKDVTAAEDEHIIITKAIDDLAKTIEQEEIIKITEIIEITEIPITTIKNSLDII